MTNMAAMREFADLIYHVNSYGPTALSPPDPEQFSMESSREMTTDDLIRMNPGLFAEN